MARKVLFFILSLAFIVLLTSCATQKADEIIVSKADKKLYVLKANKIIKIYHIALGAHPSGPKEEEGDGKTPEGIYTLDYKNAKSQFYKSFHISYPNASDTALAKAKGVKSGGDIMIHGQRNGYEYMTAEAQRQNWTEGCIALTNKDMDELWQLINVNTLIDIEAQYAPFTFTTLLDYLPINKWKKETI